MKSIIGIALLDGSIAWQTSEYDREEEGLAVTFTLSGECSDRNALKIVEKLLRENAIRWVKPNRHAWGLDIKQLREWSKEKDRNAFLDEMEWLQGYLAIHPQIERTPTVFDLDRPTRLATTTVKLFIYREEYELNAATKIFLSHKGANKPMVRQYFSVLEELGFAPWLDEEAMPAGTNLHRGIQGGFKESCAAVFFITSEFEDASFLAKEIDYAIEEKRKKESRFSIVPLVFTDERGNKGIVPELLQPFVWKEPASALEALLQIIKAIPVVVGPVSWRQGL